MRDFHYAIFDMDGTLIDSMKYWKNLGRDFLIANGCEVPEDMTSTLQALSTREGADYFSRELGVAKSGSEILDELHKTMEENYRVRVECKKNAREYVEALYKKGVKMCIATATPYGMAMIPLKKLGLAPFFSFILDTEAAGISKASPEVYNLAIERLGGTKEDTVIFEDAVYALQTAHDAGYYTVALHDENAGMPEEEIRKICDEYWREFPEKA